MVKKTSTAEDFFRYMVSVISSIQEADNQLTHKEQQFLINCLMFYHEGNDLNDFGKLTKYQISKGFTRDSNDVSVYKNKLGAKRWASTGRNLFRIPDSILKHASSEDSVSGFEFSLNLKLITGENEQRKDSEKHRREHNAVY